MSFEFTMCLVMVFALAALRAPVALSMISGAIFYLILSGQDVALAGEQILQGV